MGISDVYILIGCEESQAMCIELRKLGISAFSCDLNPCSGGHPEWHYKMDIKECIKLRKWDMVFLHPECRFMAVSGLFRNKNNPLRAAETEIALAFVADLLNICKENGVKYYGIENPVSCISTRIYMGIDGKYKVSNPGVKVNNKAHQTIQPYEFGEDASKRTCFWLYGLPKLKLGKRFNGRIVNGVERWSNQTDSGQNKLAPSENRAELRSKTYPGIAKAAADQWGLYVVNQITGSNWTTKYIDQD
jgi:hypothetical protein